MSGFRIVLTVEATLEAFAAKRWRLEHLGLSRARELDDASRAPWTGSSGFRGAERAKSTTGAGRRCGGR
jgi:hypothetical protein